MSGSNSSKYVACRQYHFTEPSLGGHRYCPPRQIKIRQTLRQGTDVLGFKPAGLTDLARLYGGHLLPDAVPLKDELVIGNHPGCSHRHQFLQPVLKALELFLSPLVRQARLRRVLRMSRQDFTDKSCGYTGRQRRCGQHSAEFLMNLRCGITSGACRTGMAKAFVVRISSSLSLCEIAGHDVLTRRASDKAPQGKVLAHMMMRSLLTSGAGYDFLDARKLELAHHRNVSAGVFVFSPRIPQHALVVGVGEHVVQRLSAHRTAPVGADAPRVKKPHDIGLGVGAAGEELPGLLDGLKPQRIRRVGTRFLAYLGRKVAKGRLPGPNTLSQTLLHALDRPDRPNIVVELGESGKDGLHQLPIRVRLDRFSHRYNPNTELPQSRFDRVVVFDVSREPVDLPHKQDFYASLPVLAVAQKL